MATFTVSPGVSVQEVDLTTVIPAVSTTTGALAGVFRWGPVNTPVLVDSENTMFSRFGAPTNFNAETFFTGANFLSYGNQLFVVRTANTTDESGANGALSAYVNTDVVSSNIAHTVQNLDDYNEKALSFESSVLYIARCPGLLGNTLNISVCDSSDQFSSNIVVANVSFNVGSNTANLVFNSNTTALQVSTQLVVGDIIKAGNSTLGNQYLEISNIGYNGGTDANVTLTFTNRYQLALDWNSVTSINRLWQYYNVVDTAPGQSNYVASQGNTAANDELHVVVVDNNGKFSGVPGTVLEVYKNLSRATDAKTDEGGSNYYSTVINQSSKYVWWANDRTGAQSANATNIVSSVNLSPLTSSFINGQDGNDETDVTLDIITSGYQVFAQTENIDVSLVLTGRNRATTESTSDPTSYVQLANWLVDNIAEVRKDCVVFASAPRSTVVNSATGTQAQDIVTWGNALRASSYLFADTGYKYQYDKYNDIYRYVPLNGDMAGLAVNTDNVRDPWWSFAGYNRGQIKNVIKLAYNPATQADRDLLYKNYINPVVTFPGQGTILYGDKTHLDKPSAFDRINVRRLFIVLEKAIATASKFMLFEFNDSFTQAQFKSMVEPYLRTVQGRRGITDFAVVCDSTNNTPDIVDNNKFVADIYIKPARSINFITLSFVAVRSGVQFSEIVGKTGV